VQLLLHRARRGAEDLRDLGDRSVFQVTERDDLRLPSPQGSDGRPELCVIVRQLRQRVRGPKGDLASARASA
jgi:hypothetical protein